MKNKVKPTDVKFLNTDVLDQIDWEKEIVEEFEEMDYYDYAETASKHVMAYSIAENYLNENIKTESDVAKANYVRTLQFFYGKFVYHHALVYSEQRSEVDLKKDLKEWVRGDHPIIAAKKKFGKVKKSDIPLEDLKLIQRIFLKMAEKISKQNAPKGTFAEAKRMFEKEGLKVLKPTGLGRKEHDRNTVRVMHDGIPYHLVLMKSTPNEKRTQKKATEEANDYKRLIKYYHPLIKEIYTELKKKVKNLWVMEGGGAQHQAFFGDKDGYIGILYLNLKNEKPDGKYSINLQSERADEIFKDLKMPDNVRVDTYEKYWKPAFEKLKNRKK